DFEGPGVANDDDPAIVTDEVGEVLIGENQGICLKDRGFFGVVDVGFDLVTRLRAQLAHQAMQNAKRLQIVLLGRNVLTECFHHRPTGVLNDGHGIGDQKGAQSGTADDHKLPRLKQDGEMAAHRHVATKDAAENDYKTNQYAHSRTLCCSIAMFSSGYGLRE